MVGRSLASGGTSGLIVYLRITGQRQQDPKDHQKHECKRHQAQQHSEKLRLPA